MMDSINSEQFTEKPSLLVFREHKHNYSPLFKKVVSEPARVLMKELIENPDFYTIEERKKILQIYTNAIELRGVYSMLGKGFEDQVSEVRLSIIPQIESFQDFFSDVYAQERESFPLTPRFHEKLFKSIKASERFCRLIDKMETSGYGEPVVFNLRKVIDDEFRNENDYYNDDGSGMTFEYESSCGDLSNAMVKMDEEGFRNCVLQNIIDNIHKRAFRDIVEEESFVRIRKEEKIDLSLRSLLIYYTKLISNRLKSLFTQSKNKKTTENGGRQNSVFVNNKKVRMRFTKDLENDRRINVFIENNGFPFEGDPNSVFDWGIGSGSGIGLASAKSFLKNYDASIEMILNIDETFTVGLKINIPIYE
ncbi:MAG: hypothetical protein J6T22_04905 [Bacteroidales bacterium]|nr:hypothetical protein [Bacteroidales bacterium]